MEKICLFCKHFWLSDGYGGSEVTPADGPSFGCHKEWWHYDDDLDNFREKMEQAKSCVDFVNYKEES